MHVKVPALDMCLYAFKMRLIAPWDNLNSSIEVSANKYEAVAAQSLRA